MAPQPAARCPACGRARAPRRTPRTPRTPSRPSHPPQRSAPGAAPAGAARRALRRLPALQQRQAPASSHLSCKCLGCATSYQPALKVLPDPGEKSLVLYLAMGTAMRPSQRPSQQISIEPCASALQTLFAMQTSWRCGCSKQHCGTCAPRRRGPLLALPANARPNAGRGARLTITVGSSAGAASCPTAPPAEAGPAPRPRRFTVSASPSAELPRLLPLASVRPVRRYSCSGLDKHKS